MARKISVLMVCDMHKDATVDAVRSVEMSVEGKPVNLDLCQDHLGALYEAVTPFLEAGEPVRQARRPKTPSSPRKGHLVAVSGPADRGAIRQWARDNGFEVSDRGRIPAAVVQQYEAAR